MKVIQSNKTIAIPQNIEVKIDNHIVTVIGRRGTLQKDFKHLKVDIKLIENNEILVEKWFGLRKELAAVRTICTHIKNMFIGVTQGYRYKMRYVYAHFPINCAISEGGSHIEVRNFLGEKFNRHVDMLEGVQVAASTKQKDELFVEGNDIEKVSKSAALIRQSVLVRRKDIRKFLDGIYVSEKTNIDIDEE